MSDRVSTGRRLLAAVDSDSWLEIEAQTEFEGHFARIDALLDDLLHRALTGERLLHLKRQGSVDVLLAPGLSRDDSDLIQELFTLKEQQRRGAWFMAEEIVIRLGVVNLGFAFREFGRFPGQMIWDRGSRAKLSLHEPLAMLTWALLEPLVLALSIPFELRGPKLGVKKGHEDQKAWEKFGKLTHALRLKLDSELKELMQPRWHDLEADAQLEKKRELLEAITDNVHPGIGARYRTYRLRPLLERYYSKADPEGRAERKAALSNAFEPTLAAYFMGDWLQFLRYIDEQPHPAEEVVTSLPEPKLYIAAPSRIQEVAKSHGVPAAELERMLAAFWEQEDAISPVHRRVVALEAFWSEFDSLHADQISGGSPLWGLIASTITFAEGLGEGPQPDLYRRLIPSTLAEEIDALWGTVMLPRYPDRIVGGAFPHATMADAFGPALTFWHEVGLTAWYYSEGPYSRTDLAGLRARHAEAVKSMDGFGTPVPTDLFAELKAFQQTLPEPEMIYEDTTSNVATPGVSMTIQTRPSRIRRGAFEGARSIISRHRSNWAGAHLQRYLAARWHADLKGTARSLYLMREDKGKAPSARQFAKLAAPPTNRWFGGDVSLLYAALGERSPVKPENLGWFPSDRIGFAWSVYRHLGGPPFGQQRSGDSAPILKSKLAVKSFEYLQVEQALDAPPTLRDFGVGRFRSDSKVLSEDIDEAWLIFSSAVEKSKRSPVQFPGWPVQNTKTMARTSLPIPASIDPAPDPTEKRSLWSRLRGR